MIFGIATIKIMASDILSTLSRFIMQPKTIKIQKITLNIFSIKGEFPNK